MNIGFRMERFIKFMPMVNDDNPDKFVWKIASTRLFNVKCMYLDLMNCHTRFLHKYLWELKITLKIKIFMWFLNKKMLVTKDNLAKQNWNGCKKSCFFWLSGDHRTLVALISFRSYYLTHGLLHIQCTPTNIYSQYVWWLGEWGW
jgi:hypothetical protein